MGGFRPTPLRAGKLTFIGGGDRTCCIGPAEETGRGLKEVRLISLSCLGEVNGRIRRLGSSSSFRTRIVFDELFSLSTVRVLLTEHSEGDGGRLAKTRLPTGASMLFSVLGSSYRDGISVG